MGAKTLDKSFRIFFKALAVQLT